MDSFAFKDAADVLSAVSEALKLADDPVKYLDLVSFLISKWLCRKPVKEIGYLIFHLVRDFFKLDE